MSEKPLCNGNKELCNLGDFDENGLIGRKFSAKKDKCPGCTVYKTLVGDKNAS